MSAPPTSRGEILTSKRQLIDWIASGEKPKDAWRIGTEHEKFLFELGTNKPLPYEDQKASVRGLLDRLTRFGWQPVLENGKPIALLKDNCSVTLEPGGQFELSGAPLETLYQTCDETNRHLAECKTVAAELGLGLLGMGFAPEWTRADIHWMPKGRYKIMREYMPKVGNLGLDMMFRTCTVQANLDFADEAEDEAGFIADAERYCQRPQRVRADAATAVSAYTNTEHHPKTLDDGVSMTSVRRRGAVHEQCRGQHQTRRHGVHGLPSM
jgi:glutamate--cysteine ligase